MHNWNIGDKLKSKAHDDEVTIVDIQNDGYILEYSDSDSKYPWSFKDAETYFTKIEIPLHINVGDWVKVKNAEKYPALKNYTGTYKVMSVGQYEDITTINIETEPGRQLYISNVRHKNQQQWEKVPEPVNKKLISINYDSSTNIIIKNYSDKSVEIIKYEELKAEQEIKNCHKKENIVPEENFEQEYAKRATKLAIKNNRVQNLIKKVEENKNELAALREGKWFQLYGRYDWKRIFFTALFVLMSFAAPGYAAIIWGWQWLAATPISLLVIAATIYGCRDKKLDNYIKNGPNDK